MAHQKKTTTLLGRIDDKLDGGGTQTLKDTQLFKHGENPGGFNIIDDPNWDWERNVEWLTEAAERGDVIRVVSDPLKNSNIWVNGVVGGQKTIFGQEVQLLEEVLGYTYDATIFTFVK